MTSNGRPTRDAFLEAASGGVRTDTYDTPLGTLTFQSLTTTERIEKIDLWSLGDSRDERTANRAVRCLQLVARNEDGSMFFDGSDEEFKILSNSHQPARRLREVRRRKSQIL